LSGVRAFVIVHTPQKWGLFYVLRDF
jgi:hypothetical protein